MATPARARGGAVPFGDLDMYVAGGGLPEGDYIIKDATVMIYQAPANQTTGKTSPARLGVMLTLIPYSTVGKNVEYGEEKTQFYSMGSKAHESFQPNPETGKGVVSVPGGPASNFNNSTNWAIFLKSLRDSGMPQGTFVDDSSVLEGTWVHMANVPEPAERAGFQAQTGEAAETRKANTIAVVTEIKDDGKPWEGTGGIPEVEAASAKAAVKPNGKPAPAVTAKPAVKPAAKPMAKAASAPVAAAGDEEIEAAANSAIAAILEKNPEGCPKLILRTGTFKAVNDSAGYEMAQAVINTFFSSDVALANFLGPQGFKLDGGKVVPA